MTRSVEPVDGGANEAEARRPGKRAIEELDPDRVVERRVAERRPRGALEPELRSGPARFEEEFRRAKGRAADGKESAPERWIDRGVRTTKVARLDARDYQDVWERQREHKHTKREIDASLEGLRQVQERLAAGASPAELRELTRHRSAPERQIGRSYVTYYEADPIRVDVGAEGRCTVVKGRHRLARARALGFEELPLAVMEKVPKTSSG